MPTNTNKIIPALFNVTLKCVRHPLSMFNSQLQERAENETGQILLMKWTDTVLPYIQTQTPCYGNHHIVTGPRRRHGHRATRGTTRRCRGQRATTRRPQDGGATTRRLQGRRRTSRRQQSCEDAWAIFKGAACCVCRCRFAATSIVCFMRGSTER